MNILLDINNYNIVVKLETLLSEKPSLTIRKQGFINHICRHLNLPIQKKMAKGTDHFNFFSYVIPDEESFHTNIAKEFKQYQYDDKYTSAINNAKDYYYDLLEGLGYNTQLKEFIDIKSERTIGIFYFRLFLFLNTYKDIKNKEELNLYMRKNIFI